MKKLFSQGKDFEALQYFYTSGGKPILYYGFMRMLEGICDPRDIEHKVGRLHADKVFEHEYVEKRVIENSANGLSESLNHGAGDYAFKSKLLGEANHKAEIKQLELVKREKKEQESNDNDNNDQTTE